MSDKEQICINALYVANKKLPNNDYRISYSRYSKLCAISYLLPAKTEILDKKQFNRIDINEGFRVSYLYQLFKLFLYLLRNRQKFHYTHFYSTIFILVGPILARLAGLPSLITVTGFGRIFSSNTFKYKILRVFYRLFMQISLRLSSQVLFQNHSDQRWLAKQFPRLSSKFSYAGSAVSMQIVEQKSVGVKKLRVLLVARLLPSKGIEDFLRVAEILFGQEFEFILVGPSSQGFGELLTRVQGFHNRGIVRYTGELDSSKVFDQFKNANIFYFPSSYGEGLARVMIESGFTQLCPIAYDIPSNRDLIDQGRGFLLKPGDISSVVSILNCLAKDRDLLQKNASAYQQYIITRYNIENYIERMDSIISEQFPQTYIQS